MEGRGDDARRQAHRSAAHGVSCAPMKRRTASLLLALGASALGCGNKSAPSATACPEDSALVTVSDYASSGVGGVALDGGGALAFGPDLGKDPALAVSRGRAF